MAPDYPAHSADSLDTSFVPPDFLLLPFPARWEVQGAHPLTPSQVLK